MLWGIRSWLSQHDMADGIGSRRKFFAVLAFLGVALVVFIAVRAGRSAGMPPAVRTALGTARARPKLVFGWNMALFLASDLSSYITGATLHPDGGALASSGWLYWPELGFRNRLPLHLLEPFADMGWRVGDFPVAERLARRILSLPLYPGISEDDQLYVTTELAKALR